MGKSRILVRFWQLDFYFEPFMTRADFFKKMFHILVFRIDIACGSSAEDGITVEGIQLLANTEKKKRTRR